VPASAQYALQGRAAVLTAAQSFENMSLPSTGGLDSRHTLAAMDLSAFEQLNRDSSVHQGFVSLRGQDKKTGPTTMRGPYPTGPTISFRLSVDVLRTFDVVFVRRDFVGSKREMSPNRPHHSLDAVDQLSRDCHPRVGVVNELVVCGLPSGNFEN
jgi:hypothetical protein